MRYLVRVAQSPHRDHGHQTRQELLKLLLRQPELVVKRGLDQTRANSVDADLAVFEFNGPGACEGPHGGLGGVIHRGPGYRFGGGDRGVQDNRTALLQERQGLLHREEQPFDVDAEPAVKEGFGDRS